MPITIPTSIVNTTESQQSMGNNDPQDPNEVITPPSSGGKSLITRSARYYCYADKRWVTDSNSSYGVSYFQGNASGQVAPQPIPSQLHPGVMISKGVKLVKLILRGRMNATDLSNLDIAVTSSILSNTDKYSTGVSSDADYITSVVASTDWQAATAATSGVAYSGSSTLTRYAEIDLGGFELTEIGDVRIYVRSSGTNTSTRYAYLSYTIEVE